MSLQEDAQKLWNEKLERNSEFSTYDLQRAFNARPVIAPAPVDPSVRAKQIQDEARKNAPKPETDPIAEARAQVEEILKGQSQP